MINSGRHGLPSQDALDRTCDCRDQARVDCGHCINSACGVDRRNSRNRDRQARSRRRRSEPAGILRTGKSGGDDLAVANDSTADNAWDNRSDSLALCMKLSALWYKRNARWVPLPSLVVVTVCEAGTVVVMVWPWALVVVTV